MFKYMYRNIEYFLKEFVTEVMKEYIDSVNTI